MKRIIGIVGFISSGKNTVGDFLVDNYLFESMSFASSLKDAVSSIFGWPRDMVEGSTAESRLWREKADEYWSSKFKKPITPRWILQNIGTNVLRTHFSNNIWLWSLENRLLKTDKSVVITDVRFPNELDMIYNLGGELWWVQRGQPPEWYNDAVNTPELMPSLYPNIHITEYAWLSRALEDAVIIDNNGRLHELYSKVDQEIRK